MRTYRYRCTLCKKEFEVQRDVKDESEEVCPKCESNQTQRIILPAPVIYKGSGFTLKREEK